MAAETHETGFTLIELLVVTVISLLLTGGALVSFGSYNENQKLRQAGLTFKNDLRLAQSKALSSQKPSSGCIVFEGYKVVFPTVSRYTVQAICDSGTAAGDVISVTLPSGVTFSGTTPLLFHVLSQGVDIPGMTTITLSLLGSSKTYQIDIYPSGDIDDRGVIL